MLSSMNFYAIFSGILMVAVIIGYLNHRFVKVQTTIAITLGALVFSFILIVIGQFGFTTLEHNLTVILSKINFHDLLINGMLSFLLFAGALRIDINNLLKHKWEIGILALIGTIVSTFLLGFLTYYILNLLHIHISIIYCMLFGALISPTDPVAVLATFKELGVPKSLKVMVEGEALFNDGIAIVIFLTIYNLAFTAHAVTWGATILLFLQQAVGGIIYGIAVGLVAYWLMKPIDDHKLSILLTLLIVTAAYTFANAIGISGPLAMVVAGIFIGNRGRNFTMSQKTVNSLDTFWELIEEILNAILFLLIGLELLTIHLDKFMLIAMALAIPMALLVRTIAVSIPMRIFKIWRRYPPATTRILIWGGLRGALALALALALPTGKYRNLILAMTYAIVAFAIVVQGITVQSLVKLTRKSESN